MSTTVPITVGPSNAVAGDSSLMDTVVVSLLASHSVDLGRATTVLDGVVSRSGRMQKPVRSISTHLPQPTDRERNLRAQDGQHERTPRQVAIDLARVARNVVLEEGVVHGLAARTARTVARRARQNGDGDEGPDEQDVQHDEEHAQLGGADALDEEADHHADERVEDGGGEDAFDGSVGVAGALGEADDLCETDGEQDQGGEGREELEQAEEALQQRRSGGGDGTVVARGVVLVGTHLEVVDGSREGGV